MVEAPISYFAGGLADAISGAEATYHRGSAAPSAVAQTLGAPLEQGEGALRFNGQDAFAYLEHNEAYEVQNGTIALWVRPESLEGRQVFVAKDESGQDTGGHFNIGMIDGKLYVEMLPGDGGWKGGWLTSEVQFEVGAWTHVAVSFGADGVHIYRDGVALQPDDFEAPEGETVDPSLFLEAHLLGNDKPIVLGAGTMWTEDTSSVSAILEKGPYAHFNGDIDGFGVWGGASPDAALNAAEVAALASGEDVSFTPTPPPEVDRTNDTLSGTDGVDFIDGGYGDDDIEGGAGGDSLNGGYGDDYIKGGAGDDQLNGGRGSDLLDGGDGDDLIILASDAGEPRLGQPYDPAENPDGELDPKTLTVLDGHPIIGDDIAIGGAGADTFLVQPLLNAKRDIILKHQNADRSINWAGVAGENEEHHDHWPESVGVDVIADFDKSEGDRIFINGHTANIEVKGGGIEYKDLNGDGVDESIITIVSNQPNGGAHDQDLLGRVLVYGDRVEVDDIKVTAKSTPGIIHTVEDLDEALYPEGVSDANPDRESSVNPYLNQVDFEELNAEQPLTYEENIRAVDTVAGANDYIEGSGGADVIYGDRQVVEDAVDPHPPISYFSFDNLSNGAFEDARGVNDLGYFKAVDGQAVLQVGATPTEAGAPGIGGEAIRFEERDAFAVVPHSEDYEILQGTVSIWAKPDVAADGVQTLIAKDESGAGDGGHFRVYITETGALGLRLAAGDGRTNHEWETKKPVFSDGEWAHVAVSFGENGAAVYIDGEKLNDKAFNATSLETPALSDHKEFFLVTNEQPWVLGADTYVTKDSTSAATIAAENRLANEFKGAVDGFGVWGGLTAQEALNDAQIASLVANGPGDLDAPAFAPGPIEVGDDDIRADNGDDVVYAGAGRDIVDGGGGDDEIYGGYGADHLMGRGGDDTIDGGHGNDLIKGGDGDDYLLSRSDAREGPVTLDPFRDEGDPYKDLSDVNGQVYESQPVAGNDTLTGGEGADTFRFETLINAKERYILDHVMPNGMIHWHGVAGENDDIHNHWVDMIGDDVITDYSIADGDKIEIVGHTTQIYSVEYHDSDGDLQADYSVITIYSQQGAGGGAHDEDRLGTITVFGDLVDEDDILSDAAPAYGIVETVYDLAEAVTPLYVSNEAPRIGFNLQGGDEAEFMLGDEGADTFVGSAGADTIDGGAGFDSYIASDEGVQGFNALLKSGRLVDEFGDISEIASVERFLGGDFGDKLVGSDIGEEAHGGGGADTLQGAGGADSLYGDAGDDLISGASGDDFLIGGLGGDTLNGGIGADTLRGEEGDDRLAGGGGADDLVGGLGADTIDAGLGQDTLIGGEGDDRLLGGGADDVLVGGEGNDFLRGQAGADAYVYTQAAFGDDVIKAYNDKEDIFVIDAATGAKSFGDLKITQDGADVLIEFGAGSITVKDRFASQFEADDFEFTNTAEDYIA